MDGGSVLKLSIVYEKDVGNMPPQLTVEIYNP